MKKLEITKNPEVCGLTDKLDESVGGRRRQRLEKHHRLSHGYIVR